MPPKKAAGPSAKTVQKEKDKIIEDKTFGLKNKNKSKKVQQYVKGVETRVNNAGQKGPPKPSEKEIRKAEKEKAEAEKKELERLMRPVIVQPKVPMGVDPKSFICEFWKKNLCTKGDKCKFAHSWDVSRNSSKIDLYTDRRSAAEDTMENWDQAQLEKSVTEKYEESNKKKRTTTTIVCKYFLEALDQRKYGWFWECPNGPDCMYVHALPPGFILKPKEQAKADMMDEEDKLALEDEIEIERAKLKGGEPVTKESFLRWKEEKMRKKAEEIKKAEEEKKKAISAGRQVLLSGRELLVFKPTIFVDDEEAMASDEVRAQTADEYDAQQNADGAPASDEAPQIGDESLFTADDDEEEDGEEGEEDDEEQGDEEEEEEGEEEEGAKEEGEEEEGEEEEAKN